MDWKTRDFMQLAAGAALGIAVASAAYLALDGHDATGRPAPVAALPSPAQPVSPVYLNRGQCPAAPLMSAATPGDGRFEVQADLANNKPADVRAFTVIAEEAARTGRTRDAEVAFLMACQVAVRFEGPDSAAAAQEKLADHYAAAGRLPAGADGAPAPQLLARAEALLAGALTTYVAQHGREHASTRRVAQAITQTREALASNRVLAVPPPVVAQAPDEPPVPPRRVAAAPQPVPAPAPIAEPKAQARTPVQAQAHTPARPEPQPKPRPAPKVKAEPQPRLAAAPAPEPAPVREARSARPSFDCSRARSVPERLICADPQLARMDRELGRLHARAKADAANPRAFQRRSDAAWREREASCRDRDCLVRWYGERREELLDDLDRSPPRQASS